MLGRFNRPGPGTCNEFHQALATLHCHRYAETNACSRPETYKTLRIAISRSDTAVAMAPRGSVFLNISRRNRLVSCEDTTKAVSGRHQSRMSLILDAPPFQGATPIKKQHFDMSLGLNSFNASRTRPLNGRIGAEQHLYDGAILSNSHLPTPTWFMETPMAEPPITGLRITTHQDPP